MPPPRIRPAPAGGHTRVAGALAAGGVAVAAVRYGLLGRSALSPEAVEALLQVFVGIAAALAAVLVATASSTAPLAAAASAPAAQETAVAAPQPTAAAVAGAKEEEGDDDDALDESAAPTVPAIFLAACKGDAEKAQRRWEATRQWRREAGIDRLLFQPNTTIELVRKHYPLWLHGRGRGGEMVLFEMAGQMDMTALKAEGLAVADLARHSTYMQEFMWEVLGEGRAEARGITVMDLGGMSLRRLTSSDTAELIKATSSVLDAHYPNRISRILVVNAPGWVASAWSIIANLMPQSLRERIQVTRDLAELHQHIDPSQLPLSYGGTDPTPPGQSPEEKLLQEVVEGVRAGRRPPALRALLDRRRAAKAAAKAAAAVAPVPSGVTGAGAEEAAAATTLALPASARTAGSARPSSSGPLPPATWHAAAAATGKAGGKPPTPARSRSPFARAFFANRMQQQQGQPVRPASTSLVGLGPPASWPLVEEGGRGGGVGGKKGGGLGAFAIPSRSPPSSTGNSNGGKGFWRRRSQSPSPRVEAPQPRPVPSPAS